MSQIDENKDVLSPQAVLMRMAHGYQDAKALQVVAELGIAGGVRILPIADNAKALKFLALNVDPFLGEFAAFAPEIGDRYVVFVLFGLADRSGRSSAAAGGGRPDMAEAGGKDAGRLDEALGRAAGELERCIEGEG